MNDHRDQNEIVFFITLNFYTFTQNVSADYNFVHKPLLIIYVM